MFAHDIVVQNSEGVNIYYNYINNDKELEVTKGAYSGEVIIPDEVTYMKRTRKVTSIGDYAFFSCHNLTSVVIGNNVKTIGNKAFDDCVLLTSIKIPNSVTSIGDYAFSGCFRLDSVNFGNGLTSIGIFAFCSCKLKSLLIPESVKEIAAYAFSGCDSLTYVNIPNSITSISDGVFSSCRNLNSITIPNSVTSIGNSAFYCCDLISVNIPNSVVAIGDKAFYSSRRLTSLTIGSCVKSIGDSAFDDIDIPTIISFIDNPFDISNKSDEGSIFNINTFNNATLYVPVGTIDKYKTTKGWKDFLYIKEGTGNISAVQKCSKPIISYSNGKLTFYCETDGATCMSSITNSDIKSYRTNEVQLGVTYEISVYASKDGFEDSETVKATLCWIDASPKTEGISNGVANICAMAVLIQNEDGHLKVNGVEDGTQISVYNINGMLVGTVRSCHGFAEISHQLPKGSAAVVKVGEKSIKVVIK